MAFTLSLYLVRAISHTFERNFGRVIVFLTEVIVLDAHLILIDTYLFIFH